MTEYGTYLYAITYGIADPVDAGLTGVGGTAVRMLAHTRLRAFVSTVPLEDFGEDALRRNLENLEWLESTARAHNHVVDSVAQRMPTAPVRLVTIYSDDDQVKALLEQRSEEFLSVLSGITGRSEWGVKAYVAPEQEAQMTSANPGRTEHERPGVAYLKRRRHNLQSREDAWQRAVSRAADIDAALRSLSVATRMHPPQDPQLSGRQEWMVLNGAYLVDDDRMDEFKAAVASFHDPGVEVEVTGPWAPYSFATLDSASDSEDARHDT